MEPKHETSPWVHDIAAAVGLLTRFPVALDSDRAVSRNAIATWAYPVVGIVMGGLLLLVLVVCMWLAIPTPVAVVLVVGTGIIFTGAMHEDGLADSADGLWGGWTRERRLEIMKDSHIGVYGVCALGVSVLLRVTCLLALAWTPLLALALIGAATLSRFAMVALLYSLPPARGGGLGQSVGRPPVRSVWTAAAIAAGSTIGIGLLIGQFWGALLLICVTVIAALTCARIAHAKIKGYTGDILGATQQVCELVGLVTLSALA